MPREYKKISQRGTPQDVLDRAAEMCIQESKSIRSVAKDFAICHVSLYRYIKKKLKGEPITVGYRSPNRVFSPEQELLLEKYLMTSSDLYFGLTPKEVRKLAFQCSQRYNIRCPKTWNEKQMAGPDWFTEFLKRHPRLSIRSPQPTSLSRATSFNRVNVNMFFDKLSDLYERHHFTPDAIYNIDETGITTVQKPNRIVARRGCKQVGAMTSAERGTLVSIAVAVNATGNTVPPIFVFPRKRFKDHFIRDGPVGCIGSANGSGWMQEDDFLLYTQHFVKHVRPKQESPVLILLDNHDSHLSVSVIDYCKENGVVLLSFPPHCSHKLQPLDRGVYGPLKKYVNSTCDSWMKNNPGKTMTIYDIPSIVKKSLPLATTPSNIMSGFSCTGVSPFNRDIFQDCDFMPSNVTDRPLLNANAEDNPNVEEMVATPLNSGEPSSDVAAESIVNDQDNISALPCFQQAAGPSNNSSNSSHDHGHFSIEEIQPFPQAGPRKNARGGRKKRKSEILTDTPVKLALEQEKQQRKKKQIDRPNPSASTNNAKKKLTFVKSKKNKPKPQHQCPEESSSEDDDCFCLVCCDTFSNSRSKEKWVQCISCKMWAHLTCTSGDLFYECQNCLSD